MDEKVAVIGALLFALVCHVAFVALAAWLGTWLWNTYMVGAGFPVLGYLQCAGVLLFLSLVPRCISFVSVNFSS